MLLLRLPYALIQWALSLAFNLVVVLLGLIVVPFMLRFGDPINFPIWGNKEGVLSFWKGSDYWWYAIRNPASNLRQLIKPTENYRVYGDINLEAKDGFQWRYYHTKYLDGFGISWGERRSDKGKREFRIGYKLDDPYGPSFTLQLRPF